MYLSLFCISATCCVICTYLIFITGGISASHMISKSEPVKKLSKNMDKHFDSNLACPSRKHLLQAKIGEEDPLAMFDSEPDVLNISFILQPVTGMTEDMFHKLYNSCVVRGLGKPVNGKEISYEEFLDGVMVNIFSLGASGFVLKRNVAVGNTSEICNYILTANPGVGNYSFIIRTDVVSESKALRPTVEAGLRKMEQENWGATLMHEEPRIDHVFRVSATFFEGECDFAYSNETIKRKT